MKVSVQFLAEAPTLVDNLTVHGQDVEVFKDPASVKDLIATVSHTDRWKRKQKASFRGLVTATTLYYWDEYAAALHFNVSHKLGLHNKAYPVYLYVTPPNQQVEMAIAWNSMSIYPTPWDGMHPRKIVAHAQSLVTSHPSLRALKATYNGDADYLPPEDDTE